MGARVIAAASTDAKLDVARTAGADELINYSDGELKDKVKALTNGRGADVIYDPVGGDLFDQCMRCINWKGRVLVIGFTGGLHPESADQPDSAQRLPGGRRLLRLVCRARTAS